MSNEQTNAAADDQIAGRWLDGTLPTNVRLGANTVCSGEFAFKRFHSRHASALVIGAHCTMDDVHFALGVNATASIGDYCFLSGALLLCDGNISIGSYVVMGWNVTIADTDFHPLDPAQRMLDAVACSPRGRGLERPQVAVRPVHIGNDVWIGPSVTIMKGVSIGDGAIIEPGSVIVRDVAAGTRVAGNPAQVLT